MDVTHLAMAFSSFVEISRILIITFQNLNYCHEVLPNSVSINLIPVVSRQHKLSVFHNNLLAVKTTLTKIRQSFANDNVFLALV